MDEPGWKERLQEGVWPGEAGRPFGGAEPSEATLSRCFGVGLVVGRSSQDCAKERTFLLMLLTLASLLFKQREHSPHLSLCTLLSWPLAGLNLESQPLISFLGLLTNNSLKPDLAIISIGTLGLIHPGIWAFAVPSEALTLIRS